MRDRNGGDWIRMQLMSERENAKESSEMQSTIYIEFEIYIEYLNSVCSVLL